MARFQLGPCGNDLSHAVQVDFTWDVARATASIAGKRVEHAECTSGVAKHGARKTFGIREAPTSRLLSFPSGRAAGGGRCHEKLD